MNFTFQTKTVKYCMFGFWNGKNSNLDSNLMILTWTLRKQLIFLMTILHNYFATTDDQKLYWKFGTFM